ncbi:hypothetical protein WJX77_011398 [Trebouxia sp. C0004]
MTVMYNGIQFAPVSTKRSIVVPFQAEVVWSVVGKFGRQAVWMGSVEGQRIFTQLLGGETADYIGAVRVFGIAEKVLFEQLTKLDNQEMIMAWQLMTHPMNSNPWPAAFVNFKASIQVFPVSIPGNQSFLEWRMELLTEQHAAAHMTNAMNDIMAVGLSNLGKYMNRSTSNSGGSSSGSGTAGGIVGSSVAPPAYGISFMEQPQSVPSQSATMSRAMSTASLTANSTFPQQPTFVPAPGQTLSSATMSHQPAAAMGGFAQQPVHAPMYGPYSQQQYSQYQQHPQLYQQHQQQHQQQLQLLQQQQQQQQALQYQQMPTSQHHLQQQAQQLKLTNSNSGDSQRTVQRVLSSNSQRGSLAGQPGVTDLGLTPHDTPQGGQLTAVPSHGSLQEAGKMLAQMSQVPSQTMGAVQAGHTVGIGQPPTGSQIPGSTQSLSSNADGCESKPSAP